jgi:flagellar M-ring protein FliF
VWQPRSAAELRNLTALAQAAVGFDGSRGDVVTVEDLPFEDNRGLPPSPLPERLLNSAEESPEMIKYAALLAGLVAVLAFGVRPALRQAAGGGAAKESGKEAGREISGAAAAALGEPEAEPERTRNQEIFEQVTGHLRREPTQSSRLLQSWIHSE